MTDRDRANVCRLNAGVTERTEPLDDHECARRDRVVSPLAKLMCCLRSRTYTIGQAIALRRLISEGLQKIIIIIKVSNTYWSKHIGAEI